jgi:polar amino acid transport system substrate-binding protein
MTVNSWSAAECPAINSVQSLSGLIYRVRSTGDVSHPSLVRSMTTIPSSVDAAVNPLKLVPVTLKTWLVIVLLVPPACDIPRDSDHTLERIQGGELRAGVVDNPPWVTDSGGRLGGVEVQLVTQAASDLGAKLIWVRGSEADLLESLHGRELDLVIGGLKHDSPCHKQVAFTRPYYLDSLVLASTVGQTSAYKGKIVAVEPGNPAAVYVRKKGATPLPLADMAGAQGLVAAPAWRLAALGSAPGLLLNTDKRVMAVAPGENAWLSWLERWLHQHQSSVPAMLRALAR